MLYNKQRCTLLLYNKQLQISVVSDNNHLLFLMNLHVDWVVLFLLTGLTIIKWQCAGLWWLQPGYWTPLHITYSQQSSWGMFFGHHSGPPEMCTQRKQKCAHSCYKSACVCVSDLLFSYWPKQVTWPQNSDLNWARTTEL